VQMAKRKRDCHSSKNKKATSKLWEVATAGATGLAFAVAPCESSFWLACNSTVYVSTLKNWPKYSTHAAYGQMATSNQVEFSLA
jgi:hypothetical protein